MVVDLFGGGSKELRMRMVVDLRSLLEEDPEDDDRGLMLSSASKWSRGA